MKNKKFSSIILHGCPDDASDNSYNKHWIPWLKQKLEHDGIKTSTPLMPQPWAPNYDAFKKEFEKYVVDENTILVGHSCGTTFIMKWLSETNRKVHAIFLVAPWKYTTVKENKEYYSFKVDKELKDRVKHIVYFTSNDEYVSGKKALEVYHNAVGGKIISLKDHGHYTQGDMGTDEFPELLEEIISTL